MKSYLIGLLALCGGGFFGCSPSESPQVGANTSWYRACDSSSECDGGLECWCGQCTTACESDDDCEVGFCGNSLDSEGVCPGTGAARICLHTDASSCSAAIEEQFDLGGVTPTNCSAGALLCESFDSPVSDEYRVIEENNSQLYHQSCLAADGAGSLIRLGTPIDYGHITMPLSEPVESGWLYARFFYFVPLETEVPNTAQLLRIHSGPEPEEGHAITVRLRKDTSLSMNFVVDGPSQGTELGVVKKGTWQCVELAVELANVGSATLSVDGAPVLEARDVDTLDADTPYDAVRALGASANDGAFFDIAFDELIVATEPIGCE